MTGWLASDIVESVTTPMDEEWDILAGLLPDGWRGLARETGAMQRARGAIDTPDTLLQLLLLHVATGLSLKQAAVRAHQQGIASISDVALLKRLRTSEAWLRELARRMFQASRFANDSLVVPEGRRLRAVDATTVQEPGATGTDWRVHFCIGLPSLSCDFYELTDVRGGETYKRVPVQSGDIILADRGYCHREGIVHVLRRQGDVVVRFHSTAYPLLEADKDSPLDLLTLLRGLESHEPAGWSAAIEWEGTRWLVRVCAIRKSKEAADLAKAKIRQAASRKQKTILPDTLEFAEYVVVLTTVDAAVLDVRAVLQLYRARWQIELCFKRFKSLLQLGHLPKRSDESARAWIEGKLLTVLLIERLVEEARFFSPWGFNLGMAQSLA